MSLKIKKILLNKYTFYLILLIAGGIKYYTYYQSIAQPVPILENSFLHRIEELDFGQTEQEVENILGKPLKTYAFSPKCLQGKPYIYKRWTDAATQASVQLIFDTDNKLSLIVPRNGNALLELKNLVTECNTVYTIGSKYRNRLVTVEGISTETAREASYCADYAMVTAVVKNKDYPYYLVIPDRYGYFENRIASTFLSIAKDTGCQAAADELAQTDRNTNVVPLLSSLFNDHPIKFELNIKPKPFLFPAESLMGKLHNITFGQSKEEINNILGMLDKQMDVEFDLVNGKTPFTYMRWADQETGGHVQLLFDKNDLLTIIFIHKGYNKLDLRDLLPQYNVPFILGKSYVSYFRYGTKFDGDNTHAVHLERESSEFFDFDYKNKDGTGDSIYFRFSSR